MNPKIYLETSVISYLAGRPSRDLVVAANQQVTHDWWQNRRHQFTLYVSELTVREVGSGDKEAAQRCLKLLEDIPLLTLSLDCLAFAETLLEQQVLPSKAAEDALHIALATLHGMDYLLTWNFKHIANAIMRYRIEQICRASGYEPPIICTPQELLEE